MQPTLDRAFMDSSKWTDLSTSARSALQGMLELATRKDCDWVVEGTPRQLGDWIGPEASIEPAQIVLGLRELDAAGYIRKYHRAGRVGSSFILRAPLIDHWSVRDAPSGAGPSP